MSDANIDIASASSRVPVTSYRMGRQFNVAHPVQYLPRNSAGGTSYVPPAPRRDKPYRILGKRLLDIGLVVLSAPVAVLLVGIAALALWIEGGAPFYRQARLGRGGERFSILKLRTMVRDADRLLESHLATDPALRAEWDTTQKLRNDPRITRIGNFLRKTSLDELPQLWNVLKGDMSLVGPRPMLPEQLTIYGDATHYFAQRPGITGYWQVSQRNDGAFRARVALDAAYDYDVSLIEDAKVLWRTVGAVINRTGC